MNPEHRYRLEQARDREVAGVDHLESDILAELHHDALCISVVAAEKHHWSITPVMRILHVVRFAHAKLDVVSCSGPALTQRAADISCSDDTDIHNNYSLED